MIGRGESRPHYIGSERKNTMTVFELENLLSKFDPDDEVDFNEMLMSYEQDYQDTVEMLEERQEKSGMYAQQDLIEMYRRER